MLYDHLGQKRLYRKLAFEPVIVAFSHKAASRCIILRTDRDLGWFTQEEALAERMPIRLYIRDPRERLVSAYYHCIRPQTAKEKLLNHPRFGDDFFPNFKEKEHLLFNPEVGFTEWAYHALQEDECDMWNKQVEYHSKPDGSPVWDEAMRTDDLGGQIVRSRRHPTWQECFDYPPLLKRVEEHYAKDLELYNSL